MLKNKIDFVGFIEVKKANPNGDPLTGNRPRVDYDGYGEISDVCIKRKIRNRLQDMGESVFVQSDERRNDKFRSLKDRADSIPELVKASKDKNSEQYARVACDTWIDVRSFGQVFAFTKKGDSDAVSVGVRGPVSIHTATSVDPVITSSLQITKSVNAETNAKDPDKKTSDTMGMKHRVNYGLYKVMGSITCQLAEKTGFSEDDANKIKNALETLFVNDASSARPEGSVEMVQFYWFKHNNEIGQYPSSKVHRSVNAKLKEGVLEARSLDDYDISFDQLEGLDVEVYSVL